MIAEWPDLDTSKQISSIIGKQSPPPFALDETNRRFAVASGPDFTVVEMES